MKVIIAMVLFFIIIMNVMGIISDFLDKRRGVNFKKD